MSFKLEKKSEETIDIFGKQVVFKKPTVRQLAAYDTKSKQPGFNHFEESMLMLNELGIGKELVEDMDADQYSSLLEYIFNSKKK